jgi:threonine/homoserine/homoserine lactone efflux protein
VLWIEQQPLRGGVAHLLGEPEIVGEQPPLGFADRGAGATVEPTPNARVLRQSAIVGLTNPKAIVFFSAVLPHFADPAAGSLSWQFLLLGTVFLAIALVSDSAWALLASSARSWFARSPRRLEAVGGAGGMMIFGVGASVALTGSGD